MRMKKAKEKQLGNLTVRALSIDIKMGGEPLSQVN
jgi:hypothetical protein